MSKDYIPNNPAGRLTRLIRRLREVSGTTPMRAAWAHALGVDENNISELLARITLAARLVDQTVIQIEGLADLDHGLYLRWTPLVRGAFTDFGMSNQIARITDRLTPEVLTGLDFCNHELSRRCPEQTVDMAKLEELTKEAKALMDQVVRADLPGDLKEYVLDKLDLLLRALEMYHVTGIRPIVSAMETIVGATVLGGKEHHEQLTKTPQGQRLWSLLGKVATLIALAEGGRKLLECMGPLMGQ